MEPSEQLTALINWMRESGLHFRECVDIFKKAYIEAELQACKLNQCNAARALELHRNTLSRTIYDLGINMQELKRHSRMAPRSAHEVGVNGSRRA
jgi:Fis family transcriptional regulator, factor for inversion stimulation protein